MKNTADFPGFPVVCGIVVSIMGCIDGALSVPAYAFCGILEGIRLLSLRWLGVQRVIHKKEPFGMGGGVAAERENVVVGQANPGVSEIPIEGELFLHRPIGATASLGGVQMHFIAILSFFHSSPVFFLEKDYRSSI